MPSPKRTKNAELQKLRRAIDKLDKAIIAQVAGRLAIAGRIGELKKRSGAKIRDPKREALLQKLHAQWSVQFKISKKTITKIFALIMEESKRIQK